MRLRSIVQGVCKDPRGNAALEYGLIAGFVSLVIVAGLLIASPAVSLVYSTIGSTMSAACASGAPGGTSC